MRLTAAADPRPPPKLLGTPESPRHVGILAIAGDRGLAGSYNSGVLRATERLVAEHRPPVPRSRSGRWARRRPRTSGTAASSLAESFIGFADRPEFADARHIAAVVAAPFVAGEIDLVQMVSTRFISAGIQRVETHADAALPLPEAEDGPESDVDDPRTRRSRATPSSSPKPEKLLVELAPRALEAEIFAALLEGAASFFTAQQRAMAAATENADELVRP